MAAPVLTFHDPANDEPQGDIQESLRACWPALSPIEQEVIDSLVQQQLGPKDHLTPEGWWPHRAQVYQELYAPVLMALLDHGCVPVHAPRLSCLETVATCADRLVQGEGAESTRIHLVQALDALQEEEEMVGRLAGRPGPGEP